MLVAAIARRDLAALMLAAVCWGLGTVISKAALAEIPPVTLLAIQLASSLAVLSLLMRHRGIPFRRHGSALLGRLGLLNPGIAYALSLLGLMTISASVSVLLWAFEPLVILLLAAIVLHERVTPALLVLSAIAVAGMGLVVYDPRSVSGQLIGVALTIGGVVCCAAYTVITRRFIPDATETSQVVLTQQAHGLAVALLLALAFGFAGGELAPTTLSPSILVSAVVSGVLYYAGAYWLYLGALRRVPASIAAASFYLIPLVGIAGGALLLGERLGLGQWVGAVVVLTSVVAIFVRTSVAIQPSAVRPSTS